MNIRQIFSRSEQSSGESLNDNECLNIWQKPVELIEITNMLQSYMQKTEKQ